MRHLFGRPLAARLLVHGITPLMIGVGIFAVTQSTHAAYSGTTVNPSDAWATGQVTLTDDDSSTAMFTVTGARPGDTGQKCIVVTAPATNTFSTAVRLYATNPVAATNSLDTYLNVQVEEGSGGSFSSCTGFTPSATDVTGSLASFTSSRTNYTNAVTTSFSPTGGTAQSRTFRFTWTLSSSAPNTTQDSSAGTGFTWEAQ